MLFGGDRDVPEGIGMARLPWTRLPTADAEGLGASTSAVADDDLFSSAVVKSLDYEVIENYTYREEQAQRGKFEREMIFWLPYGLLHTAIGDLADGPVAN
ncbi:chloride channel protein CLC-d-like isoform X2 [Phragmites australis]|uniref:chloride channel protein CLC-d-like isoform X2 n=1 Tax=Phragmites australis TaxID=29695 RepID=UPI002D7A3732|nr:chloride channel protein CLC-d-like isoform X2 [Phragmites australis]